ncbi:hypothetical protein [Elstera cyanobacteriorum]|uniref:hypothetical protein n=1 Tax=Elstera cyanobacteriorum TaxID=2022747 RepID=UPI0023551EB5|nr:hypothetical protein [Elstera cyanobacteriorum]MCK6443323.1 hypothetical protein [Elstera cyanobacteriorum]
MRRIPKPGNCRSKEIREATQQKVLRTYPHLLKFGLRVQRAAAHYDANRGNPLLIRPIAVSSEEKKQLHYIYEKPPKKLAYIAEMREKLAGETCPMCGGQDPVSLDHFLPKGSHAEFSLLPYNLVPACSCNMQRGEVVADYANSRRLLHPYYDDCLANQLYIVSFDPNASTPIFSVNILIPVSHNDYENVNFHIENVVLKTNIKAFLSKRWEKLKSFPDDMLIENRRHRDNISVFRGYLMNLAGSKVRIEGENAWESVFFRSIAEPVIASWIFMNT